ncbi:Flavodoxin family protein/radical SAM domain-containing protein isoform 3 [Gossypium australe]|uniref:Flavodoxin family protein/radical SAM domain-containing protein isoform 3 n=1 Tax=Gossypium australe TaxID=47621 RepID=A0A5B6X3S3_9ROSI|nr:Flavodoxin family protein/radical SAM domain-containing protein isoform 3 [Gossypium australe]
MLVSKNLNRKLWSINVNVYSGFSPRLLRSPPSSANSPPSSFTTAKSAAASTCSFPLKPSKNPNQKRKTVNPKSQHVPILALYAYADTATFYFLCRYSRRLKPLKQPPLYHNHRKGELFLISQTRTSKALAKRFLNLLSSNISFDLVHPGKYLPEGLPMESLIVIIASTWEDGNPPQSSKLFFNWLHRNQHRLRAKNLCMEATPGVASADNMFSAGGTIRIL